MSKVKVKDQQNKWRCYVTGAKKQKRIGKQRGGVGPAALLCTQARSPATNEKPAPGTTTTFFLPCKASRKHFPFGLLYPIKGSKVLKPIVSVRLDFINHDVRSWNVQQAADPSGQRYNRCSRRIMCFSGGAPLSGEHNIMRTL